MDLGATVTSIEIPSNETESTKKPVKAEHPIAVAIDRCIHRARDHKLAARSSIPGAIRSHRQQFEKVRTELVKAQKLLDSADPIKQMLAIREMQGTIQQFERLKYSELPRVIETSLFLGLFSAFDAFTGDLLVGIFSRKPALFGSLNRTISFAQVLEASSLDAVKQEVLQEEIEQLRRNSYVDQFAYLSSRFDVKLTAFDRWAAFVERAQRRNLLTYCDGVVSDQYRTVCEQQGYPSGELPPVGTRLRLGASYFLDSCELLIEVALKLGQTLWRKTLPQEIREADQHLKGVLYDTLLNQQWKRAQMIGEFAVGQRVIASDLDRKILLINYAQALKFDGQVDRAREVLSRVDWSASANDFKLAEAVLLENYELAADLMLRIGERGELIEETGYHIWPLFHEFRQTDQFAAAYEKYLVGLT